MNTPIKNREEGFTIVELLVVIIVIGILAAITIIAYNGLTTKANIDVVKSDLVGNRTLVDISNITNGTYPISSTTAGLKLSAGNSASYVSSFGRYCLSVSNTNKSISYHVTNSATIPISGGCWATVSSYVNNGQGVTDGSTSSAQFNIPTGLAIDSNNTIYVADSANNRIRTISASGTVSTLAGSTLGYNNATGTSATFNSPSGVAVDLSGNVFVADSNNNAIRKITPAGVVTTFAGSATGIAGTANGNSTVARFNLPEGIVVDGSGNIYVADTYNHMIRKITSAGVVTLFAGQYNGYADGTGASASFSYPQDLALDSAGNVYVADTNNCAVRMITPAGVVTTVAGTPSAAGLPSCGDKDGIGSAAKLNQPNAIFWGSDNSLYITDTNNQKIKRMTIDGTVTTIAGSGSQGNLDGNGDIAQFSYPWGIVVDNIGNIYVTDQLNNAIRKVYE